MALRKLVYYGDPLLRQKAKKIHRFDASLLKLVQGMFETMHAHDGIKLAAPQIAVSVSLSSNAQRTISATTMVSRGR